MSVTPFGKQFSFPKLYDLLNPLNTITLINLNTLQMQDFQTHFSNALLRLHLFDVLGVCLNVLYSPVSLKSGLKVFFNNTALL